MIREAMPYTLMCGIPRLQNRCATLKCVRSDRNRIGKQVLVLSGFLLLLVAPGPLGSQSNSSGVPMTPNPASPPAPAKSDTRPIDDFAGLTLTDGQKAKIAQIRQDAKLRRDAVVKNERLTQGQKDVTLQRLQSLETSQIFKVLTPDQQAEVHKRMIARRAAEEQGRQSKQPSPAPQ